jgi:beta-fructofuranosidase
MTPLQMANVSRRQFVGHALASALAGMVVRSSLLSAALAETIAARLVNDPRRPQFHLLPAANWMNDPNGPIYWNGSYHMFYQYNPNGAFWGDMHWGHAMGPDMIHWTHLPVALSPTPGGPDAGGCFSGTAVVKDGVVTLLYTGVVPAPEDDATIRDGKHSLRESQCLATTDDPELKTWSKLPKPVIATPPANMKVTGFRDPSPWRSGEWWYMTVGSGIPNQGGAVLLYRSKDLQHWEYLHVLASGRGKGIDTPNKVDSGDMWECPDLFLLDGEHVLIYSTAGKACWQSGELDPKQMLFHPKRTGVLDYGSYYAPKTQLDKSGQRILWGWIPETRPLEQYRAAGWAGMMSLPRVVTVDESGLLSMSVAPAVEILRRREQILEPTADEEQNQSKINGMRLDGCCGEILCKLRPSTEPFSLTLVSSAGGTAGNALMSVRYDPNHPGHVSVDDKQIPINLDNADSLDLHMFVDGSVIELIVNKQAGYTKRFYYAGAHAPEIALRIAGKSANVSKLTLWQLTPISPNRLTI